MLKIQKNILLGPYTTFKIGGSADYFAEANNAEEVEELCRWAKEKGIPIFILGGGSNVLVSDKGFEGLVIKILNSKFVIRNSEITADAGVPLAKIVSEAASAGLSGLEWAIGIPGTIGGAIFGNTGAYGHSISEIVIGGKAINSDGEIIEFSRNDCNFYYRGSIFKEKNNKLIIIEVELSLMKSDSAVIREKMKEIIAERAKKIPSYPSAGSFFSNYRLQNKNPVEDPLVKKFPDLIEKEKIRSGKIGVGYLIEQCGLKGKRVGGAMVAQEHANFIVNVGGATAGDVLALAEICKKKVKEKYGLELEIEKRLVGFD